MNVNWDSYIDQALIHEPGQNIDEEEEILEDYHKAGEKTPFPDVNNMTRKIMKQCEEAGEPMDKSDAEGMAFRAVINSGWNEINKTEKTFDEIMDSRSQEEILEEQIKKLREENTELKLHKGIVIIGDATKPVNIILNPEDNPSALIALKIIAKYAKDKDLKTDLKKWIEEIEYIFYSGK